MQGWNFLHQLFSINNSYVEKENYYFKMIRTYALIENICDFSRGMNLFSFLKK